MSEISTQADRIDGIFSDTYNVDEDDKSNSDELMLHNEFDEFWDLLRPVDSNDHSAANCYQRWRSASVNSHLDWRNEDRWSQEDNEYGTKMFDMHFGRLAACEDIIQRLIGTTDAIYKGTKSAKSQLKDVWTGTDADAATEKLQKLQDASYDASYDAWPTLMQNFQSLKDESHRIVEDFVDWVLEGEYCQEFIGKYRGFTLDAGFIYDPADQVSAGDYESLISSFSDGSDGGGFVGTVTNVVGSVSPVGSLIDAGYDHFFSGDNEQEMAANAIEQLNDVCWDFYSMLISARARVRSAHDALDQALQLFAEEVGESGQSVYGSSMNPFADLIPPEETDRNGDNGGNNGNTGNTGSSGNGSGSGSGGNYGSPGGPSGSPAQASTPSAPASLAAEPAEAEVEEVPGGPTEDGDPIGPEGPQTSTVTVGGRDYSVTEPSDTGEMRVTVPDGQGGQRSYNLDFDPNKDPQQGGQGGSMAGGGFGPQGSGAETRGEGRQEAVDPEDEEHTPDEDGKIHISDGDLEIVAEQPLGPDGATVVTIDDGTGEPITQVVGDEAAVEEFNRRLGIDEQALADYRGELESSEQASAEQWDDLREAEQDFRERGGVLPEADEGGRHTEGAGADGQGAASGDGDFEPFQSAFDVDDEADEGEADDRDEASDGEDEDRGDTRAASDSGSGSSGGSLFEEAERGRPGGGGFGGGASGIAEGVSSGVGGGAAAAVGGAGAEGVGGSLGQDLTQGTMSGVGAPVGAEGGAGVGTAPGGSSAESSASGSGRAMGGGGMMGGGMMGGGAGGGGGGDEARTSNAAYQVHGELFEPDLAEGPFGVARISGSLDEE